MEAKSWVSGKVFPPNFPLLNVSQAAPVDPPPLELREVMAKAALNNPEAHLYGPVLGMSTLRAQIAEHWSRDNKADIHPNQVAITSGCNQAYCAAIQTLARAGDNVILVAPWYFNHKMWLDMMGIECRVLNVGANMLPDLDKAATLIDQNTRAIAMVSPNNPTGAEYPGDLLAGFATLARSHGLSLIVDETYRDFDARPGPVHRLFQDPEWDQTFIHLYSFSKAFRLTGHRVGAMLTSAKRLAEAEKFLDTVTISPSQIGQIAALHGLRHMGDWLAAERAEILTRRAAIRYEFADLNSWQLREAGAYFAYVAHPFDRPSDQIARQLVDKSHVLCLPGTMFAPKISAGGTGEAERHLRIAFANIDSPQIGELAARLRNFQPD